MTDLNGEWAHHGNEFEQTTDYSCSVVHILTITSLRVIAFKHCYRISSFSFCSCAFSSSSSLAPTLSDSFPFFDPRARLLLPFVGASTHRIARFEESLFFLSFTVDETLASFVPDFERFALNLACCPNDDRVASDGRTIRLNDTVEINDLFDDVQYCYAVCDGIGSDGPPT